MLLAINNAITPSLCSSPANLEVITVKVSTCTTHHLSITLCIVYIPPNSSPIYYSDLLDYLRDLISSSPTIIMGDFNSPDINWSTLSGSTCFSSSFCDFVFDNNLHQLITSPTHIKGNILDLVITNLPDTITSISIDSHQELPIKSDHFPISFSVLFNSPFTKPICSPQYIYNYSKANWDGLIQHLLDYDFTTLFHSNSIEFIWSSLKSIIISVSNLYIPKIRIHSHQRPKWFTQDIQHHLNQVHSLRKKFRSHPTTANKTRLDSSEKLLQQKMILAKTTFEENLVNKFTFNKDYHIFKYINYIISHKHLPTTIHLNSTFATSDSDKAFLYNRYFNSTFSSSSSSDPPSLNSFPTTNQCLSSINISDSEVYEALLSLNPTKSMGIDKISPQILKHGAVALFQPIHHLFTQCLIQSSLPTEWRVHLITPIHKSGDTSSVSNYRPISLLCIVSKVLERIIHDKIIDFVSISISDNQFGFLRSRSSVQQLLLFLNSLQTSLSQNSQIDAIYLDFSKAFDKVPHNHLLLKLRSIGITGNLWNFFKSYLFDRTHCVSINSQTSSYLPVLSGVPQGSILGPLLFLIYINDLPASVSSSTVLLFADDNKCFKTINCPSDSDLLQSDLDSLSNWSQLWNLPFNTNKSLLLRFTSSQCSRPTYASDYHLNNSIISSSNQHRDLGVIFSSDLSWKDHYSTISSKAYRIMGLLRRSFSSSSSVATKKTLYISLIRSKITYASQIWHPHLLNDVSTLERIQRRATKFILNDYTSDYKSRLQSLHLLPLMMTLEIYDVLFFIKSYQAPQPCFNISNWVHFNRSKTRSSSNSKLYQPVAASSLSRHHYFNRLPRLWNALPVIDLTLSLVTIKKHLTNFLWSHFQDHFNPDIPCTFHFVCPCNKCSSTPNPTNFNPLTQYLHL